MSYQLARALTLMELFLIEYIFKVVKENDVCDIYRR